jgi:AhpD family alkylhydroperoxidase
MTRIEGVPAKRAGLFTKVVYRMTRREFGRMMDPVAVYAHAPGLMAGYGMFEQATARQKRVPARLKALAVLKAASVVNCEFCVDIASSLAREAGIGETQMLALPRHRESAEFDETEKLVLDYAGAISRTPARVSQELFAALHARFDERQLVELTNEIVLENARARFNSAFDMTPAGFSEGMVCVPMEQPAEGQTVGGADGTAAPSADLDAAPDAAPAKKVPAAA